MTKAKTIKTKMRGEAKEPEGDQILEMQLKMATSSINHEYARIEFDDTDDHERREELLEFMDDCRSQYIEARNALVVHDPYALETFEADLLRQKQVTLNPYHI
jgi:Cft2 family RNA processing exonuclease